MAVHRFSVNVPNPAPTTTAAQLSLKPVLPGALRSLALPIPKARLKVDSAGLGFDPCQAKGKKTLRLTLKPYESVDVQVIVVTAPGQGNKPAMAAFHLEDKRAGQKPGGVTVVCVEGTGAAPNGPVVSARNPCPATIVGTPYPVGRDADPSKPPANKTVPLGADVDLVVPITNATRSAIAGVQVYLEHLGRCDAQFAPITWNIGTMVPEQVFYATWPVSANGWMTGTFKASVVVGSDRTDAVRLSAPIRLGTLRQRRPKGPR